MRKFNKLFAGAAIASAMVLSSVGINVASAYPTDPIQLVVPLSLVAVLIELLDCSHHIFQRN
jgi:hypothetical protein